MRGAREAGVETVSSSSASLQRPVSKRTAPVGQKRGPPAGTGATMAKSGHGTPPPTPSSWGDGRRRPGSPGSGERADPVTSISLPCYLRRVTPGPSAGSLRSPKISIGLKEASTAADRPDARRKAPRPKRRREERPLRMRPEIETTPAGSVGRPDSRRVQGPAAGRPDPDRPDSASEVVASGTRAVVRPVDPADPSEPRSWSRTVVRSA